jgi:hypothetical protein
MDENKFWMGFNIIVGLIIIVLILSVTFYNNNKNTKVVELIKSGTPAIEALCAIDDSFGDNPTCVISAVKDK